MQCDKCGNTPFLFLEVTRNILSSLDPDLCRHHHPDDLVQDHHDDTDADDQEAEADNLT